MRFPALSLSLLALFCHNAPTHALWSVQSRPDKDINYFCKGDGQAISGYVFTSGETITSSSSSSSSSSNSSDSSGTSSQSSLTLVRSIKQAKTLLIRVFCVALDGSVSVTSNASISTTGAGSSSSQSRECDEFSAADGVDAEDKQKNCQDGEYLCGLKVSQGGTRYKNVCCKLSSNYDADSASGCRVIGPIPYSSGNPAQVMNPSDDNKGCSVDAAVGLGLGDDGVKIKTCSFNKKGKQVGSDCKQKKDQAVQKYVEQRTSGSTNVSSTNTSSSSSSTPTNTSSSPSDTAPSQTEPEKKSPNATSPNRSGPKKNGSGPKKNGSGQKPNGSKAKQPAKSAGKEAGKQAAQQGKNTGNNAAQQGQNAGKNAGDSGKATGQNAAQQGQNAGKAGQNAGQNAAQAGQSTGQNAAQAGQNTGQGAAQQGQNVGSKAAAAAVG